MRWLAMYSTAWYYIYPQAWKYLLFATRHVFYTIFQLRPCHNVIVTLRDILSLLTTRLYFNLTLAKFRTPFMMCAVMFEGCSRLLCVLVRYKFCGTCCTMFYCDFGSLENVYWGGCPFLVSRNDNNDVVGIFILDGLNEKRIQIAWTRTGKVN